VHVLLIEVDPMIGAAIQGALKDACCAADWVNSGKSALATPGRQRDDLVLLDLGLAGQDGLEVLASIRAKDKRSWCLPCRRDARCRRGRR
jgi:two-component system OmpR family response regulator